MPVTVVAPDFVVTKAHERATGADGRPLGESQIMTAIAAPDGAAGQAFAIHQNAQAVRRYNNSIYYVLAVGLLSDLGAG